MPETVAAPPRGLDLFAARPRRKALRVVGSKRQQGLRKLGIETVQDLLQHYPRYHVDRTQLRTIAELKQLATDGEGGDVTVHAEVLRIDRPFRTRTGKRMIKGRVGDETGSIEVTWFNQDWVARALKPGMEAFFYGRLGTFRGKLQMTAPRFELGSSPFTRPPPICRATRCAE